MKIEFFVPGIPRPGGSKKSFPIHTGKFTRNKRGKMIEVVHTTTSDAGGEKTKSWREDVRAACQKVFSGPLLTGPLKFTVTFYMPYRKGDFQTGKNAGALKRSAPIYCTTKPDSLKLRRSTEDALTGILYVDDAQIVQGVDVKRYGMEPGAQILVETLDGVMTVGLR